MRSDRKATEEREQRLQAKEAKKNRSGFSKFTKVWALVFLGINLVFGAMLFLANILATKYLVAAGLVVLLLLLIIFPPLYSYKTKKVQRVLAFILSCLVGGVYVMGSRYLAGTMDFMSQITKISSTDEYYVVVRDDDMFNELGDIAGETVHAYHSSTSHDEAVEDLKSRVEVEVVDETDIKKTVEDLLSGETNVILLSSGSYASYNEENDSFDDYTKILESFKIKRETEDISKPVSVSKQPFNMYITGIDTHGTIDVTARSDVNMIATVNPNTRTILLTSIPRDYYVLLTDVETYDKLTHTGVYGANYTIATVENLLGIDINYYVKVNFTTVVTLVDAIGGIDIVSDYTFVTNSTGFYFEEGLNENVSGEAALAFARERYAFQDGDFQRNKDQQIVMKAIIDKISQSSVLIGSYTDILGAVEENIEMNMTPDTIKELIRMQTEDMSAWNIVSQSIVGPTGEEYCYWIKGYASVVLQDQESMDQAVEKINAVMAGESIE